MPAPNTQNVAPVDLSGGLVPKPDQEIDLSGGLVEKGAAPANTDSTNTASSPTSVLGEVAQPFIDQGKGLLSGAALAAEQTASSIPWLGKMMYPPEKLAADRAQYAQSSTGGKVAQFAGEGLEATLEFVLGDSALKGMSLAEKVGISGKIIEIAKTHPYIAQLLQHGVDAARGGVVGATIGAAKAGDGNRVAGAVLGGAAGLVPAAMDAAGSTAGAIKDSLTPPVEPTAPIAPAPTPKPNYAHTPIDVPFDDAAIQKMDKNISDPAAETLKKYIGNTSPAGSTPKHELLRAVKPVDDAITARGSALQKLLQQAPPLKESPMRVVDNALVDLMDSIPGDAKDPARIRLSETMLAERAKLDASLNSKDPLSINQAIRKLDDTIQSYKMPNKLDTASEAAAASKLVIRRTLRNVLNDSIPASKPINDELSANLELRKTLYNKLGARMVDNPSLAQQTYDSEFQKGKTLVDNANSHAKAQVQHSKDMADYKTQLDKVKTRQGVAKTAAVAAGGAVIGGAATAAIKHGATAVSTLGSENEAPSEPPWVHVVDPSGQHLEVHPDDLAEAQRREPNLQVAS